MVNAQQQTEHEVRVGIPAESYLQYVLMVHVTCMHVTTVTYMYELYT